MRNFAEFPVHAFGWIHAIADEFCCCYDKYMLLNVPICNNCSYALNLLHNKVTVAGSMYISIGPIRK